MLTAAAVVLVGLGLLHSILGELMVFRRLPGAQGIPSLGFPPLLGRPDSATPTLRACWHVLTVLGSTLAWLLARIGAAAAPTAAEGQTARAIAVCLVACATLMALGTRGKHLGWIGFLGAAILCWLGAT